jgi:hypothetical protein
MLRVTVTTLSELTTVILEGRLAGAWVPELATCWRKLIATRDARSIQINLDGVTFIDGAGKALIRAIQRRGAGARRIAFTTSARSCPPSRAGQGARRDHRTERRPAPPERRRRQRPACSET